MQHYIPFRVASDSSRFFTLEATQFLDGKNRKAACDFGPAPYFRKLRANRSPRRGEILVTPYKRSAVRCAGRPRAPARGTGGRYGRTGRVMPRKRGKCLATNPKEIGTSYVRIYVRIPFPLLRNDIYGDRIMVALWLWNFYLTL